MSFSTKTRRPAVGPIQPPTHLVPGFFPEVERPGRETDHSPPSPAAVKNKWSSTSAPPICPRWMDRDNESPWSYCRPRLHCQLLKTPGKLEVGKVVLFKVYSLLVQLVFIKQQGKCASEQRRN